MGETNASILQRVALPTFLIIRAGRIFKSVSFHSKEIVSFRNNGRKSFPTACNRSLNIREKRE